MSRSIVILTRDGKADEGQKAKLVELKSRLSKPGAKLLVHLHGGLVDETGGLEAATRLAGRGASTWDLEDEWTQLYIVWRTGAFETIRTNWMELAKDDRFYQTVLLRLIKFVARKIGIPAPEGARSADLAFDLSEATILANIRGLTDDGKVLREPFADVDAHFAVDAPKNSRATVLVNESEARLALEFQEELARDRQFQRVLADIDNAANNGLLGRATLADGDAAKGLAMLKRMSKNVRDEIGPIDTLEARTARGPVSVGTFLLKHAGLIIYRCFKRFRTQRDHGFHATIVEELCRELYGDLVGAKVWGMMVDDAGDHFVGEGLGVTLVEILKSVPTPDRFVVTGHSAGSIWAARFLIAMQKRGVTHKVKLFLLAPAIRQDLFVEMLNDAGHLLESCRMFTMTDELERRDAVLGHDLGFIYPSSLLYCVSGLFEERDAVAYADAPLLGMRRFENVPWLNGTEDETAKVISQFFQRPANGVVLSPTSGICESDTHGGFDDEPHTLKTVVGLF